MKMDYKNERLVVCVIGRERNPFNDVLFHALSITYFDLTVVYTVAETAVTNNTSWPSFGNSNYRAIFDFGKLRLGVLQSVLRYRHGTMVFTGYNSWFLFASMLLCHILGVRYLVFTDTPSTAKPSSLLKRFIRRVVRHFAFRRSAGVLTTGAPGRRFLLDYGVDPSRIVNYPYTSGSSEFESGLQSPFDGEDALRVRIGGRIVILCSGQLIYRKGVDCLIYALSGIQSKGVGFYLLIEGGGGQFGFLKKLVQDLSLEDCVEFVGFSNPAVHARMIALSDVVVAPSRWDPWGNIVQEAMLLGKPVVSSVGVSAGVDRLVHGENGFLFDVDDVSSLKGLLLHLESNPMDRARIGLAARVTALGWGPSYNSVTLAAYIASLQ